MNLIRKYKLEIAFGVGIIFLYFLLRLPNLTGIPVFVDEAIYIHWAQIMRDEPTLRFLPLQDGKQPLFMWVVIPFLKLFSDPLVAGRMVSVMTGFGSMVGIFLLTQRLFKSKNAGFLSALLYTVSPYTIFFDRIALVDSMLTMFGIWTLYFLVITVQTFRLDSAMLSGFALGGALLTKSPALFFVGLLPITALLGKWKEKEWFMSGVKIGGLWLITLVIAYGMYNILRLGPDFALIAQRNSDYVYGLDEILRHPLMPFLSNVRLLGEYLVLLLPLPIFLLVGWGIKEGVIRYRRELLIVGVWFLAPVLVGTVFARDLPARYFLYAIPPLFIISGLVFNVQNIHTLLRVLVVFAVSTSLFLSGLLVVIPYKALLPQKEKAGYFQEWTSGTGVKEVAEFLKEERTMKGGIFTDPDRKLIVGTEGFFGTLPNGLEMYLQGFERGEPPKIIVIGVGVWISDVHPSLLQAKTAGDAVYLVVNDTRFKGNPEKSGLRLLNSYPKQRRPDGTKENLLLFEVTEAAIAPPPKTK